MDRLSMWATHRISDGNNNAQAKQNRLSRGSKCRFCHGRNACRCCRTALYRRFRC
ncbi:hypothetical protein [Aurantiacibacter atlanticus]|uniref:hypothetical protein n=1 Tax=Aurantiacibacter atlanticus TaxID=1648404 RepID=UPI003AAC3466